MARHLNVDLFVIEPPGRHVFYSEVVRLPTPSGGARRRRGPLAWVLRQIRGVRARWKRSRGGAAMATRRAWDWLHSRTHPDEPLYARLRTARSIDLRHPTTVPVDEVAREWSAFLAAGLRRHSPWFVVNLVIAPASLLLALLPGPNLVGYWFAYRAVHHLLIMIGIIRTRGGWTRTRFLETPLLDRPIDAAADAQAEADRLAVEGLVRKPLKLGNFLRRLGLRSSRAVAAPADG